MWQRIVISLSGGPPLIGYLVFAVLVLLATMPAWRLLVFGMTMDDWLQLRCF